MDSLTPVQIAILERLIASGFRPVAFAMVGNAIGLRRGGFAALLEPVAGGTFRLLGQAFYMIDGNLSVRVRRNGREWFVWKGRQIAATPELLDELAQFSSDLSALLSAPV